MTDWPDIDRRMTSGSNFKLIFCNRPWDTNRVNFFHFGVMLEVYLSEPFS